MSGANGENGFYSEGVTGYGSVFMQTPSDFTALNQSNRYGAGLNIQSSAGGNTWSYNADLTFGKTVVNSDIDEGNKVTTRLGSGLGYSRALTPNVAVGVSAQCGFQMYGQKGHEEPGTNPDFEATRRYNQSVTDNNISKTAFDFKASTGIEFSSNSGGTKGGVAINYGYSEGFGHNRTNSSVFTASAYVKQNIVKVGENTSIGVIAGAEAPLNNLNNRTHFVGLTIGY